MNKSCRTRWGELVAHIGKKKRNICWILVGNPEGKKALGSPRYRRENSIKMNLNEVI
jgi:hypothetical protein